MPCFLPRRAPGRAVLAGLLVGWLATAVPAHAADAFAVTAAQLQGLGVTLQRLEKPAAIPGPAYPARVVLPPSQEQVVSAPLAGLVDRVLVSENDNVKAGQPLLRLVSPELGELQLKLLEAAAKGRLSQQAAQRERALFAEGIIPERRVQEADVAAEADRARLQQAQAALRLAGLDAARIRQLAAGAALQDSLTVHAQAAGTVMTLDVKAGQRVAQASPLMRLADTRQLWLDIQLPADRRAQVAAQGSPVTVLGHATPVAAITISLGAMVSDNQSVTLRARVTQGAARLRPGEYVQVQVPFAGAANTGAGAANTGAAAANTGAGADSWPLPVAAVVRQGEQAYVFVRTPTGFFAQAVAVVHSAGAAVQVQGPLKAGQEIAVTSVVALKAAWLGKSGGN